MYDEQVMKILKGVADKTKNKSAEAAYEDEDVSAARCAAHCLFDEAMEMVEDGMSWKEVMDDLIENLKAIPEPKAKAKEEVIKD